MCGLTVLYADELPQAELRDRTDSALNALVHRGPDEGRVEMRPGCAIGHRRLSILDIRGSHQPMADPSERFVIAYNGEVYNYRELRKELEGSWEFRTQGDTEVVLAGLVRHGESFLAKMQGMWGLALWDSENRSLFLARDRVGKKPLYYCAAGGAFSCASELPALMKLSDTGFVEDLDSSADYLKYGYCLPGTTIYDGVYEVLPGHCLKWSRDGVVDENAYWSLRVEPFRGTVEEAEGRLDDLLVNAVRKRMVSDVEVGAFLSGGVDSSLMVALMRERLDVNPKTFSIGFGESGFDESGYARLVAERFGTDHFESRMDTWDRGELFRLIDSHVGQPFYDASILPTSIVSRLASRHVKVALSGDGGDELFSGYQRYQARTLLRWYTRLPATLRSGIGNVVRLFPEPRSHHSRSLLKKAHLFIDIVERQRAESPYVAPVLYSHAEFQKLTPDLASMGHPAPGLPEVTKPDDIQEMMVADATVYLPQDVLAKVDRASMAHGLEVRAPFLDHEVMEFAFSLPRHWHRNRLIGKRMLKGAFNDLLPQVIWRRRKQGFGVPLHRWFREGLGEELRELLFSVSHPFSVEYVSRLLDEHMRGSRDNGYRLWNIYAYLAFRRGSVAS